ncbi:MAG: GtrA family protein [Bacteroidota bacterium]
MDYLDLLTLFKFAISGLTGVAINFSVTWFLKEILKIQKYIANSTGLIVALAVNFILNRNWTFVAQADIVYVQLYKFIIITVISILLNHVIVYLFHQKIKINFYYAKVVAVFFVFFWNYSMHSLYTFG